MKRPLSLRDVRAYYDNDEQAIIKAALGILTRRLRFGSGDAFFPQTAGQYMTMLIGDQPSEVFAVMFLNNLNQLIATEKLFYGTVNTAEVHPREIIRHALHYNAAGVILGHNHPSGSTEPSSADRETTLRIEKALKLIDVRVLDHFVVCAGAEPVSFASRGWLS